MNVRSGVGGGGATAIARTTGFGQLTNGLTDANHPRLQGGDQAACSALAAQLRNDRGLDRHRGFQIQVGGRDRSLQASSGTPVCPRAVHNGYPSSPSPQLVHGEEPV